MPLTIPYDIDYGTRNAVLTALAQDIVAAGGTVTGLDKNAGETHPNWVMFINQLNVAANALGATPPLPTYRWLDYSAFGSCVKALVAALHPITNPPPVANAASFNVTLPASNLSLLGTLTSTPPGAGTWNIVSGNAAGYFMLAQGSGQLLTSNTGSNMTAGTYTLGVTCANANGVSAPGTVTVTAA